MASDGKARGEDPLLQVLRMVAPGTELHEALEHILRARTGALLVVGDSEEVLSLVNGGFRIDAVMHPSALYELAKMDGAIVLSSDAQRILYANTQLVPDPMIPSLETGTRHRTAERVARQAGVLVIAISQRRNVITLYRGDLRYVVQDIGVLLAKANQALSTLDKYRAVLDQALNNLSAVEFEDLATLFDVTTCIQRAQMVSRIGAEIDRYVAELGEEGRLVRMQLEELMVDAKDEGPMIVRDYLVKSGDPEDAGKVWEAMMNLDADELLDHGLMSRLLGYGGTGVASLDLSVTPRGYRVVRKIPRVPMPVIENLVSVFQRLPAILNASIEELDDVEGIGEVRARAIKQGLNRLREQVLLDRHL